MDSYPSSLSSSSSPQGASLAQYHSQPVATDFIAPGHSCLALGRQISKDTSGTIMEQQDVSIVMGEALFHLERIAEHFREKDSNGAANDIAKSTISILSTFNNAIADWDIQKCLMKAAPAMAVVPLDANGAAAKIMTSAETLDEQVKKIKAGSWASVAATAAPQSNHLVKFRPGDGITRTITADSTELVRPQDARVIWIKPWDPEKRPLSAITEKIDQGPLFSMAHSQQDGAVCVIFQHAPHARAFLESNVRFATMYGQGLFGPGNEVLEGQAYPATEDIRQMDTKNERRRLTFARCRLFANGTTEARFKSDIYAMVGEGNVELVWLFNSGNATVVFSATAIARTVRNEFLRRAACPGPYQDVTVSFSHDPCERPLNLITQMPGPRNGTVAKVNGGASDGSFNGYTNSSNSVPRPTAPSPRRVHRPLVDSDGWQTVGKRK